LSGAFQPAKTFECDFEKISGEDTHCDRGLCRIANQGSPGFFRRPKGQAPGDIPSQPIFPGHHASPCICRILRAPRRAEISPGPSFALALRRPASKDNSVRIIKLRGNTAKTPIPECGNPWHEPEDGVMVEPKLEVPAELRDLAEKTIDQAEKAFGLFFDAAGKSIASIPNPGADISRQALSFTEQNMKAAFEHARRLVHATDLQQAMQIQSEFLRSQFTSAGEHMRQITGGVMSAAKDATKGKS
jgi:phasin